MSEIQHLTADEAIAALTAAAFEITDKESSDYGRKIVHCFRAFTGADWDLADAIELARTADDRAWLSNIFDHELAILSGGKLHKFDVKRPTGGDLMTPAEELRTAAKTMRGSEARDRLAEPLAALLESAAEDSEVIGTDYHALAVARVINGGAS